MNKDLTTTTGDQGIDAFSLRPRGLAEASNLATTLSNTDLVPKNFKNKPDDILAAMIMGSEVGLAPLAALQNIAVINGRPSIWGDALLGIVISHPDCEYVNESFNEDTMTATCTIKRKNHDKHSRTFSKADAEKAGLWEKSGPWTNYPDQMLRMRARGFSCRDKFPDALRGLSMAEESQDIPSEKEIKGASVVTTTEPGETVIETKAEIMPEYPAEAFTKNLPGFLAKISAGRATVDNIVGMIQTRFTMTDDQKKTLTASAKANAPAASTTSQEQQS